MDFNERSYEDKYVSQDDVRFIHLLGETIKQKEGGQYEMPLLFKGSGPPSLRNNKKLAIVRLQHLKKKLKTSKQYYDHYTGDVEPAPSASEGDIVWYIPHHWGLSPQETKQTKSCL